eukprot:179979-Lingulodinium_polyedra.AAC.1
MSFCRGGSQVVESRAPCAGQELVRARCCARSRAVWASGRHHCEAFAKRCTAMPSKRRCVATAARISHNHECHA